MVKMRALERDGATIAFRELPGPRRAVVLTHGAGVDHVMFDAQATALAAAGHRVVSWDLRGHGSSALHGTTRFAADDAVGDLGALLDELALDRPVLVGHSLGGNLAQEFVRRHPTRAGGLVVVDSTWNAGPLSRLERLALRLAAPSLRAIPARHRPGIMARASAVTPEGIAYAEDRFSAMPASRFIDVWNATASLVNPDPGYRTPVPLTLVRGERDRTGNIASAMPRWAAAEGAREHVIPDAGHIVSIDAPAATTTALRCFLEELR